MARLLRPHIDLETKLRVLLRQLGDAFPDEMIAIARNRRTLGILVQYKQEKLAELLGCDAREIDYDHDPPLGAREKVFSHGVHVEYSPRANDPDHIVARPRSVHKFKTNVRGEHGQHPDRVLIKKNRRIEQREEERLGLRKPKPTVRMKSANRWPPRGSRPLNGKRAT